MSGILLKERHLLEVLLLLQEELISVVKVQGEIIS